MIIIKCDRCGNDCGSQAFSINFKTVDLKGEREKALQSSSEQLNPLAGDTFLRNLKVAFLGDRHICDACTEEVVDFIDKKI